MAVANDDAADHASPVTHVKTSDVREEEGAYHLNNKTELVSNKKKRKATELDQNSVTLSKKKAKKRKLDNCSADNAVECETTFAVQEEKTIDEEIEIWVPNRKYKGSIAQKFTGNDDIIENEVSKAKMKVGKNKTYTNAVKEEKPFMTFTKSSKVPPALVRKGFNTPKTEPRSKCSKVSIKHSSLYNSTFSLPKYYV